MGLRNAWETILCTIGQIQPGDCVKTLSCLIFGLCLAGCGNDEIVGSHECINALTADEKAAGWHLLFDGKSLSQWRSYQEEEVNDGWGIENGCLTRLGFGGDIITREQFGDFELKVEWRISDAGNSGIFIRGNESGRNMQYSGYEMQVLDNAGHYDASDPTHRAGAYYDMLAPDHDTSRPVGHWNRAHIIARGPEVQFWLNDHITAQFEQGSADWQTLYENSKFADRPDYGSLFSGHIGLQDHWDKVWFRNIRALKSDRAPTSR